MTRDHRIGPCSFLAAGVALLAIVTASSGCDSASAPKSARISKSYDGRFSNTISYESFGTTSTVDCGHGKSLNVVGSNNKLTVRGRCETVDVPGADNRITIDRVDKSLTIIGLDNSVTYRSGEPTVDDRGSGNTVTGPEPPGGRKRGGAGRSGPPASS